MHVALRPLVVYLTAAFFSLLISFHAAVYYDLVNPDAICYLSSAAAMKQGLHYAMHLCPQAQWPFYSLIIYALAKITTLNITASAYVVNALFSLISVLVFITIVKNLNNNPRLLWLSAVVILLAHEFNALRQDVIRDHGFTAFYLLSILCFIKYFRHAQWRYACYWSLSLVIATLFRIEAAIFLLFLPFIVWLTSPNLTSALKAFLQLHFTTLILVVLLVVFVVVHPTQNLSRLNELPYQFAHGWETITQNFQLRTSSLAKYVLVSDSLRDARLVFVLTLLSWYLIEIIKVISPIYFLLVLYAWCKGSLKTEKTSQYVLWSYIAINVLITLAFLAEHLFLSKRYLVALTLVLMIWVPFSLNYLINKLKNRKGWMILLFTLIIISSLGGIVRFGYSKTYIPQAGKWISVNVPSSAKLYSNDYQLMYYSHHFGDALFQKVGEYSKLDISQHWKEFDYLAIRDGKWNIPLDPIIVFKNKRGDHVAIYKVRS